MQSSEKSQCALGFKAFDPKPFTIAQWAHELTAPMLTSAWVHLGVRGWCTKVPLPCVLKTPAEQRILGFKVDYLGINGLTKLQKQKPLAP